MSQLRYTSAAAEWEQALPIGNGRLGAMVYGRTDIELLQLNESSVWYGGPQDRTPRDAYRHLARLRELIRAGNHEEAENLVRLAFFATPHSQRHCEPLGSMTIEFGHVMEKVQNYKRSLDLETAVMTVQYDYDGVKITREIFASHPDEVIVVHITASESIEALIRLDRVSERESETNEFLDSLRANGCDLTMEATPGGKNSNSLCCGLRVQCGPLSGTVTAIGNAIQVRSRDFTILIGARTGWQTEEPAEMVNGDIDAAARILSELLVKHVSDYQNLYRRMYFQLFPDENRLPTDERIKLTPDPGLAALYHNYGRYLLISCSRDGPDALPATLQGIWNPSFQPTWGAKYTININTEMNYWPANVCNLAECEMPLFRLLERMAVRGAETAKVMYGCRGWCCHHNTDIWADTDPQDRWMPATLWPLGGAWLCTHIFESFEFSHDLDQLRRMYPVLRGCIEFLLDFLIPDAEGRYLVTSPSLSPENSFIDFERGAKATLCEGSAIDIQIITTLFQQFLSTCPQLQIIDDGIVTDVQASLKRLPPPKIGASGQLQEWQQDYEEVEPGHRHISHLWALHPGTAITPSATPELAAACNTVLQRRAQYGSGHTGWSRAWLINMHARLLQGEEAVVHVKKLLMESTMPNLLDVHPPFQIDGNFGGCAGILEMLVQSHGGIIQILPACPGAWQGGRIAGVRCRGGFEVAFEWKEGHICGPVTVKSSGYAGRIVLPNSTEPMALKPEIGVYLVFDNHVEKPTT